MDEATLMKILTEGGPAVFPVLFAWTWVAWLPRLVDRFEAAIKDQGTKFETALKEQGVEFRAALKEQGERLEHLAKSQDRLADALEELSLGKSRRERS